MSTVVESGMDQDNFRLVDDDTMRHLRILAASGEEHKWRFELIATVSQIRQQAHIYHAALMNELKAVKKDQLSRTQLIAVVNTELTSKLKPIEDRLKPVEKEAEDIKARFMKFIWWAVEKIGSAAVAGTNDSFRLETL